MITDGSTSNDKPENKPRPDHIQGVSRNQDFYKTITDEVSAMIAYWTKDRRCQYANKAFLDWFGKPEEEILLIKMEDMMSAEFLQKQGKLIEQAFSGTAQYFEEIVEKKNGEVKIVRGEYLPDIKDGEVLGFYSLVYDITSLKAAEENILSKNEELSNILGRITDGFISLNKYDDCTFANKKAAELLDVPLDDLQKKNFGSLFTGLQGQKMYESIRRSKETGAYQRFVEYFPIKMVWNEFRIFPSESGISIFVRDVTQQKEEENRLRLLESIIRYTGDAIIIMSDVRRPGEDPTILFVNEAFRQLTGYSDEEVIGKSPAILQGPKTDLAELNLLKESAFRREASKTLLLNYDKYGKPYWVEFSLSPVINMQGECSHWIAIQRNVTERVLQEERSALNNSISEIFSQQVELPQILSQVLERLAQHGDFLLAEIWLRSFDKQALTLSGYFAGREVSEKFYSKTCLSRIQLEGEGFIRNIWKTRQAEHMTHVEKSPLFLRKLAAREIGLKSAYGIPLIDSNGVIQGVLMIGMDHNNEPDHQLIHLIESISSHLAAEIMRKKLELDLAQTFRQAPDIIAIAGVDGFFKKVNPAMISLLEYSESELLSQNMMSFIHPEDVNLTLDAFNGAAEGKPLYYFENRLVTKRGDSIWLAWTVSSATENGLIFCVAKDTTERKISEQKLINLNQKLEDQNEQLRDISWVQSHMVRAPLANILGLVDILGMDNPNVPKEVKDTLLMIKKSATELDEVIARINDLSKIS